MRFMEWLIVFGMAAWIVAAALVVRTMPWPGTIRERDGGPEDDPVAARLARHVQHQRNERLGWLALGLVGIAFMAFFPWHDRAVNDNAMRPPSDRAEAPGCRALPCLPLTNLPTTPATPATPATPPPAWPAAPGQSVGLGAFWAAIGFGALGLTAGTVMLVAGRGPWVKTVGTLTVASTLLGEGALIKEVKLDKLLAIDGTVENPVVNINGDKALQQLSRFGPKHLGLVAGFASGSAVLADDALAAALKEPCRTWRDSHGAPSSALVLVIGSADRVPLSAAIRSRYESNVGLAMARAELVRSGLQSQCKVPPEQIVTLVAGPRHTPAAVTSPLAAGHAPDRSVAVWGLFSVPAPAR